MLASRLAFVGQPGVRVPIGRAHHVAGRKYKEYA